MPLILVLDSSDGGTARVLAPIQRSGLPHELFRDAGTALQHMFDPFFAPIAHVIVIAPAPVEEQTRLLADIAAHRPELAGRIVLLTERADGPLADLAKRLRVHALLAVPFGVEDLADAIGSCVVSDRPKRLAAATTRELHAWAGPR